VETEYDCNTETKGHVVDKIIVVDAGDG
jgi:hypothetical protein